jgi:FtsH-binding integral membrane protein
MYVTSNLYNTLFGIKSFMTGGGSVFQLIKEKRIFLFKVFLNLLVQLAITYFIMTKTHLPIPIWIAGICSLVILIILALIPMPIFIKFLLFSIFSFFMGVLLSQDIQGIDKSSIQFALIGVACIFLAMMFTGIILLMVGIELGIFTFILLFFGLLIALLLSIIQFFSTSINQIWLSNSIIGLFAIFIIYDTQRILRRNYHGDFITASMDYYLDIINIFVRLLKR